jgi:opacity protein-like surface antigen
MKKTIFFLLSILCVAAAMAQEKNLNLAGGYVFTNIESSDINANGFRINGLFDFNPQGGMFSHGFSLGYIHTSATDDALMQNIKYKINTFPAYYAPKLSFGKQSLKVYVKGALGLHFSHYNKAGEHAEINDWDAGFFGGAGAGVSKSINEKISVNLEYEWDYMTNTAYVDGFVNSVMLGVGIKL